MMAEFTSADFQRLVDATRANRRDLVPRRNQRLKTIKEFVGHNWREDWPGEAYGDDEKRALPLLELAVGIHVRELAPENPRALVTTQYEHLKPGASNLGLALDQLSEQVHLGYTLRRLVMDALMMIGCAKIALAPASQTGFGGLTHQPGLPFTELVHPDDLTLDMQARSREGISLIGNRSREILAEVQMAGIFYPQAAAKLKASPLQRYDEEGGERAEFIGREFESEEQELDDHVEIEEAFLPQRNLIVTWASHQPGLGPLRVEPWTGPAEGPYLLLGFEDVPDSVMPLAPCSLWRDMHELGNLMFNHVVNEALQTKRVFGYRPGHEKDARRLRDAESGEFVSMQDPSAVAQYSYGGPDQVLLAFVLQLKKLFYELGGNLELMGGLGPATATLGQDRLLHATASKRLEDMQARMREFVGQVYRHLGFYLWTGPFVNMQLRKGIPGTDLGISVPFNATTRRGSYLDYAVKIEPYSLRYRSPEERLQLLLFIVQNLVFPMMGYLQQHGIMINFERLMRMVARYSNMEPEMSDLLIFAGASGSMDQQGPAQALPGQGPPAATRRIYEQIYRPQPRAGGLEGMLERVLSLGGFDRNEPARMAG